MMKKKHRWISVLESRLEIVTWISGDYTLNEVFVF